jgi:hypothetical protein
MTEMLEVYRQLRLAQDKYIYFILAAAGAGIALAVNQTQTATLSWSQLPLGGAVLSWGLSFFVGCQHLRYVSSTLYANAELLKVERGLHPKAGTHPDMIAAASEGIREAIESNSNRASFLGRMQTRLLILGAVLYVAWHVWEMWLRTAR